MFTPINTKQLTAGIAIHPGEFLMDELNAREIKQNEFATLIGMAPTQLNEVIKGKRAVTAELAMLLEKTLQMKASFWMNAQTNYELDLMKIEQRNQARLEALDIWQMVSSWIPARFFKKEKIITGDPVQDLPVIKEIYQVTHFDEIISKYREPKFAMHRKSEKLPVDKINLLGWEQLVMYKAEKQKAGKFDIRKKEELVNELKTLFAKNKKTIANTEQILTRYGIKFIAQTTPEKCAVEGIAFWNNGNPAIGLSIRYKRIDNFAFNLMHELGHVFLHLSSDNKAQFVDIENQKTKDIREKEANEFASENMISKTDWQLFKEDYVKPGDADFKKLAKKHNLHPGILLGRYCHETQKYNIKTSIDKNLN